MKNNRRKIICSVSFILLATAISFAQNPTGQRVNVTGTGTIADSSLNDFTIEELSEFQQHYRDETERLLEKKARLRRRGLQEMEAFVKGHPNSPILDKVLIRLANLVYEQASQDFMVANDEYSELVESRNRGELQSLPPEPQKDYSRVLSLYQQVIEDFPQSKLIDDAIYLSGFILEDLGRRDEAYQVYSDLVAKAPDSEYLPDALMRMAEYNFNPPVNDIAKSIELYKEVLKYEGSSKYDAALYRLGWAYYKLNDYPEAIAHFTLLADDIDRFQGLDPDYKYHFPEVRSEALQYIGISFLDFGGPERAAKFLNEIGGREYGFDILRKIGDSHLEVKEQFGDAVKAYELLLAMYPDSPEAPGIESKLVEAYRNASNERMAYEKRSELFQKYKRDGDWWKKIDDPEARKEAVSLAAKALRDNINMLLTEGEKTADRSQFLQSVNDSREYLAAFPSDSNAVMIHWNMALTLDTKLSNQDEAFDEYIQISNLYWDSEFQKQAAENAIALADEAVRTERPQSGLQDSALNQASPLSEGADSETELQPEELTENEERLVDAINNHIKLFPYEPGTAKMLAKAGGVYYERRQFKEALKYFKTLAKHHPDSEEAGYAQYLTMESYFGKGDFESAEILARRLKAGSPNYADQANKRLSETMFLKAKKYADSADHVKAAEEFQRMVAEVPSSEFADKALYNAALAYEEAKDYHNAVRTYTRLVDNYPQSENLINSLNNLAFDYRELEDYHNAALTYQRLADVQEGKEEAQVALFNASVSFVQAQEWQNAIAVNARFVEEYPDSDEADNLLFDNAGYYLRLNDIASANKIYEDFATKFADSPRAVEAFYHRGMYFLGKSQLNEAQKEFDEAIRINSTLEQANSETNNHFAAEALYQLTEIKFNEFDGIEFRLPQSDLTANKKRKKELLLELVDNYTRIAAYGTTRLYQASYRIGEVYEGFARVWATQEIPVIDDNKRILAQNEIAKSAAELYEKAVDGFKDGVKVLTRFSSSESSPAVSESGSSGPGKLTLDDTTRVAAQRWLALSKDKISENLFNIADIKFESAMNLAKAPPPAGLQRLEELIYRNQVLTKVVSPSLVEIITAHERNIDEGSELGLKNQWVESSREKIVLCSNLLPVAFKHLGKEAILGYQALIDSYNQLIEIDDESAYDVADQMSNFIELGRAMNLAFTKGYKQNIATFKALGMELATIRDAEESLMQAAYEQSTRMSALSKSANSQRGLFEERFKQTDKIQFEDAAMSFDEKYFALNDGAQELLDSAAKVAQELEIRNGWTDRINLALIQLNPEQYASSLGFKIESETISSSSDWMVTSEYSQGWMEPDFADAHWSQAHNDGPATALKGVDLNAIWLVNIDHTELAGGDSSSAIRTVSTADLSDLDGLSRVLDRPDKVYFRKSFDIEGLPVSGIAQLFLDDSFNLYVNGQRVGGFEHDASQDQTTHTFQISEYLKTGRNVVAIEASDLDNSRGSLEASLEIRNLPDWFKKQGEFQSDGQN